jgi:hypothetical protein
LKNSKIDATIKYLFLGAYFVVNRVRPNRTHLTAHNTVLSKGVLAKFSMTKVELKPLRFSGGHKSLSIDSAVVCRLQKRMLFMMIKKKDISAA